MAFNDKVRDCIQEKNSLLCVGLDTAIDKMPEHIRQTDDPLFTFNKAIIDATAEYAAAFKVNTAFYEAYGVDGWLALQRTLDYLPRDVIRIADAKRGDIGNTAQMYAHAIFDTLGADAVTVNAYMGHDSAAPFLANPEKGVFFLCLTSNPGSRDLQYFTDGKQKLYERMADLVLSWNGNRNCGLVVGATHPDELAGIRGQVKELPLLIPGIGAQGGDLEASVTCGTDPDGMGALFNSSRAIIYASSGQDFQQAAATAAKNTRDALNAARNQ